MANWMDWREGVDKFLGDNLAAAQNVGRQNLSLKSELNKLKSQVGMIMSDVVSPTINNVVSKQLNENRNIKKTLNQTQQTFQIFTVVGVLGAAILGFMLYKRIKK